MKQLLFTVIIAFLSLETAQAQNNKKQEMILVTKEISHCDGDQILRLTESQSKYTNVRATLLQDGPGRFGLNIGIEFLRKGEIVRVTHVTRYQNGNYGLKTKSGGPSLYGWQEASRNDSILEYEIEGFRKYFPLIFKEIDKEKKKIKGTP